MESVKVKRGELLAAVKENREKHNALFVKAFAGFKARAIDELERRLSDAKAGRDVVVHIGLVAPTDQTTDYDRVIRMLEMSVTDEIELSSTEFAQYVMDDWTWKRSWTTSNAAYIAHS